MQVYNDRPPVAAAVQVASAAQSGERSGQDDESKVPQPVVSIIVDGKNIYKPGMKSVFVEADNSVTVGERKNLVGAVYCTCNSVCTCESVTICSCQGVCSCNSQRSYSSGCSCAPVH